MAQARPRQAARRPLREPGQPRPARQQRPHPGGQLPYGASGIADLGRASVRGEPVEHYKATLDLTEAADRLPADARARYRQLVQQSGMTRIPSELWVDHQGRVRKIQYAMDLSRSAARPSGSAAAKPTVLTTEYYDFGTAVDVQLPPPSQVADVTALVAGGR